MTTFNLPDLGEGLPEAEIVTWLVKEGDAIEVDQPMVSVETAKAVVEVPSPYKGIVRKLYAKQGDMVATGQPLVDFELAAGVAPITTQAPGSNEQVSQGQGMVVGHMASGAEEIVDTQVSRPRRAARSERVRAAPAVRMLAKRLNVDLATCPATGKRGLVSVDDVLKRANLSSGGGSRALADALKPWQPFTDEERLRGPRRAMAYSMSLARDEVAMCTVFDDADIDGWRERTDITARIVRAIVAAARKEPGLNAVFDPSGPSRRIMSQINLGIAVDTSNGLIVPVLRDVGSKSATTIRTELDGIKERSRNRTIAPEEMRDCTFTLSNFGTLAGRYATPLVVPPAVAILATGRLQRDVVAGERVPEIHARIPLSLTFDHRCITGGEACRFLAVVIEDLSLRE
jgi:pyruvate dehydrogenase E2 component (dihydrolipoamide acetyltransferase)